MRRPFHANASSRLDALLEMKAKEGVQVVMFIDDPFFPVRPRTLGLLKMHPNGMKYLSLDSVLFDIFFSSLSNMESLKRGSSIICFCRYTFFCTKRLLLP